MDFLSVEDREQILPHIIEKVEDKVKQLQESCDELKNLRERERIDYEQKQFELERLLVAANQSLEAESQNSASFQKRFSLSEEKYADSCKELSALRQLVIEKERLLVEAQTNSTRTDAQSKELVDALQRKSNECIRLLEDIKHLEEKLAVSSRHHLEALEQVAVAESNEASAKSRMQRLQQELELKQRNNDWLNGEIKELNTQLLALRKEKSTKLLELQAELHRKTEELKLLEESSALQKKSSEELAKKLESYMEKLKESRESQVRLEEQYCGELQAQSKLTNLYKSSASDAQAQVQQLTQGMEELQALLKTASAENSSLKEEVHKEICSRDEKIKSLEEELNNANELLEQARSNVSASDEGVEHLSTSAALGRKLMKSGLPLTQIFSECLQAQEALQLEKQENMRLNHYMEQILEEIREKAPILKQQREDYERSLDTIALQTQQLDKAMQECDQLRATTADKHRVASDLQRTNDRLRIQVKDLNQQVRVLLKELEEARGNRVLMQDEDMEDSGRMLSSSEVSSSSQFVISKHLVTFRSITELQEQNQRLLQSLRELSDKQEAAEFAVVDEKTQQLEEQLKRAMNEVRELSEARERQTLLVDSIVQQRDMYRSLCTQQQPKASPGRGGELLSSPLRRPVSVSGEASGSTAIDSEKLDEATKTLKLLQDEFSVYRKEKNENEKLLSEQLEKARQEASELRAQSTRFSSQLEFTNDRFKVLQSNVDAYKKEIKSLHEKNVKANASVEEHERVMSALREDAMNTRTQLAKAQAKMEQLISERDHFKSVEARLAAENESLYREMRSQSLISTSLQAIQNNLERSDYENNVRLGHQLDRLDKENTILRQKLDEKDEQLRSTQNDLERQVKQVREELGVEKQNYEETVKKLQDVEQQLQQFKEGDGQQSWRSSTTPTSKTSTEEVRQLNIQLNQCKLDITALQGQLSVEKSNREKTEAFAKQLEQTCAEQMEMSQQIRNQLDDTQKANAALLEQLTQLTEEHDKLLKQHGELNEQLRVREEELSRQLAGVQQEMHDKEDRYEQAINNERLARELAAAQCQLKAEADSNYQRELQLHASDVQSLGTLRQKVAEQEDEIRSLREETVRQREVAQAAVGEQKRLFDSKVSEISRLSSRLDQLTEQNNVLHRELEEVTSKMTQLQRRQEREDEQTRALSHSVDVTMSPDRLQPVIKFLRREKELAETEKQATEAENNRLKQQLTIKTRELEESTTALYEERAKNQESVLTAAQYAELMSKVEMLNIVKESNFKLRSDYNDVTARLQQADAEVVELREKMQMLSGEYRDAISRLDTVDKERTQLQQHIAMWQKRAADAVEHGQQVNAAERERFGKDIQGLQDQLKTANDQLSSVQAEFSNAKEQISTLQKELLAMKQVSESQSLDVSKFQTQLNEKEEFLKERNKIILQLKQLGNRLKSEGTEKQAQVVELQGKVGELEKQNAELQTKHRDLLKLHNDLQKQHGEVQKQNNELQKQHSESQKHISDMHKQTVELQKKLIELQRQAITSESQAGTGSGDEQVKRLAEETAKLRQEVADKTARVTELDTEGARLRKDKETSEQNFKRLMERARNLKIENDALKKDKETLTQQNEQQKQVLDEKELLVSSLRSHMERQNQQASASNSDAGLSEQDTDNSRTKVDVEKQLLHVQPQQQPQPVPRLPKQSAPAVPLSRNTATRSPRPQAVSAIRPLAPQGGSTTPGRLQRPTAVQTRPVQSVRMVSADKATASIRPMAVAHAPTATVLPTTVVSVAPEGEPSTGVVSAAGHTVPRPMQHVQPVPLHVDVESVTEQPEVEPAVSHVLPLQAHAEEDHGSQPQLDQVQQVSETSTSVNETVSGASAVTESSVEEETAAMDTESAGGVASTSVATVSDTQHPVATTEPTSVSLPTVSDTTAVKRSRDVDAASSGIEDEGSSDSRAAKRTKHDEAEEQLHTLNKLASTIQVPVAQRSAPTPAAAAAAGHGSRYPRPVRLERPKPAAVPQPAQQSQEVVVVDSSEEEEENVEEEEEEMTEEEEEDNAEEQEEEADSDDAAGESDDEAGQFNESTEEDEDEEGDRGTGGRGEREEPEEVDSSSRPEEWEEEREEVPHVEAEEEVSQAEPVEGGQGEEDEIAGLPTTHDIAAAVVSTSPVPVRSPRTSHLQPPRQADRLPSASRSSLIPFHFASEGAANFEFGDDCTVPSTPTLVMPKRSTDGFAEAVNSPSVGNRFFSVATEVAPSQLQDSAPPLIIQGGVDDTRVDLDLDSGVSVTDVAPSISITAPSPPAHEEQLDAGADVMEAGGTLEEQQEDAARAEDILSSATRDTGEIDIGMLEEGQIEDDSGPETGAEMSAAQAGSSSQKAGVSHGSEPSTSSGASTSRQAAATTPAPPAQKKRIQPITWTDPSPPPAPRVRVVAPAGARAPRMVSQQATRQQQPRQQAFRPRGGSFRGLRKP